MRDFKYERLRLSDGRVLVVSARFWSDFLAGTIGCNLHGEPFRNDLYFAAFDRIAESNHEQTESFQTTEGLESLKSLRLRRLAPTETRTASEIYLELHERRKRLARRPRDNSQENPAQHVPESREARMETK